MRSRKVSPGLEVIFTLILSDKTRVLPVTAERSPPASRITGADSPVMAESSTDATPSRISPSDGINSPAETNTKSPARSLELGTFTTWPLLPVRRFAIVSERALRNVSACALPRPSAIASAKLANKTVNQSHNVICRLNLKAELPWNSSTVVITLPISTTNMTGLPIILRGFSFRTCSQSARPTIFHSQIAFFFFAIEALESLARAHKQVLQDRAKAQRREKRQRAHNQNHANQQCGEQGRSDRERSQRRWDILLCCQVAGDRQHGDDH